MNKYEFSGIVAQERKKAVQDDFETRKSSLILYYQTFSFIDPVQDND